MPEIKAYPYLVPNDDAISIIQDWYLQEKELFTYQDGVIEDWDPAVNIDAEIVLEVDLEAILSDCNFASDARLRLVTGWRSSGTMLRDSGQMVDLQPSNTNRPLKLCIEVDGINLARDVILFAALILVNAGSTDKPLAPKIPGAVLWKTEQRVILDETALRFPTEIAAFSERDWPIPTHSAWYLQWDSNDLSQSIFGDVRLYLNKDHPVVLQALSGQQTNTEIVQNFIFFDLARTLLLGALSNSHFVANPASYPQGTIGAVIHNILKAQFPNQSVKKLEKMTKDTSLFNAYLQARLNFLRD